MRRFRPIVRLSDDKPDTIAALLVGLVLANVAHYRRPVTGPRLPGVLDPAAGVRYVCAAPFSWQDVETTLWTGNGCCADLAAAVCAECRVRGGPWTACYVSRVDDSLLHVYCGDDAGRWFDPAHVLGMPVPPPAQIAALYASGARCPLL